uniref:IS66 family transposase n=1 Tax=Methylomonas albis TaxID=1854563 RepID=UPI001E49CA1D|nr:IS66 family transposase [Methylomonas albis]
MTDSGPPIRLFSYTPGRGGSHAQPLYEGIQPGTVFMSDGYEVYNAIAAVRGAEQRGQQRQQLSKPVLAKIEGLLVAHLHGVTPDSLLGKALHYLSSQCPKLIRFVDNGAWPIDNNLCENAYARSSSVTVTGYSATRWLVPRPAPISTR